MTMKQIRKKYRVPAKRGMIVCVGDDMKGKIIGSRGFYLRIKIIDPDLGIRKYAGTYHPTDKILYPIDHRC